MNVSPPEGKELTRILDGRYAIGESLGEGGAGRIHRGRHLELDKPVAIKILHEDDDAADTFRREARSLARLHHPNVVAVTDFGVDGDVPYLVMELLEGESLRARLSRAPLAREDAIAVIESVGAALEYCHEQGVIHRDVKPENVFFARSTDGSEIVKVVDFGLAIDVEDAASLRTSGRGEGTPAYMSPEQLSGEGVVGPHCDVFALGALAYECLVGARPFPGETYGELVLQICTHERPVPSEHASVPASFDAWFARSCARDPAERHPSVSEQMIAFSALASSGSRESIATSPSREERSRRRTVGPSTSVGRRRWALVGLAAALVVVCAVAWRREGGRPSAPVAAPASASAVAMASAGAVAAPKAKARIAVAPFRVLSSGDDDARLAEIAAVEIASSLSSSRAIDVLALSSTRKLAADASATKKAVVEELDVSAVGEGTLRIAGARAILTFDLVDARSSTVRRAGRYEGPVGSLEALARNAALDVLRELDPEMVVPARRKPAAPAAYTAYAYGRHFLDKRNEAALRRGITYFEQALAIDPDYTPAWVGLAEAHRLLPWMSREPVGVAMKRSREALDHATRLDPNASAVVTARAAQDECDLLFGAAERGYRRGIELEPSNALAHQWLGELLVLFRRDAEAMASMDRAIELDPLNANTHRQRVAVLFRSRRFADAEAAARHALTLDPEQPYLRGWLGYALMWQGRNAEGLAEVRRDPMSQPAFMQPFVRVQELVAASLRHDDAEVQRLYAQVVASQMDRIEPTMMAIADAAAGKREDMYRMLDEAFARQSIVLTDVAVHPSFDPYRGEPAFKAFLARVGLTPGGPARD